MSEWQPIDSAPRDGAPILGYSTEGVSYVCWWREIGEGWCFFEDAKGSRWYFRPTHWQPMPAPPLASKERV